MGYSLFSKHTPHFSIFLLPMLFPQPGRPTDLILSQVKCFLHYNCSGKQLAHMYGEPKKLFSRWTELSWSCWALLHAWPLAKCWLVLDGLSWATGLSSLCSLILWQAGLDLITRLWQGSEKEEAYKTSWGLGLEPFIITFVAFHWPMQISRPDQNEEVDSASWWGKLQSHTAEGMEERGMNIWGHFCSLLY